MKKIIFKFKTIRAIWNFFKEAVKLHSQTSHKRTIALLSFAMLATMALIEQLTSLVAPPAFIITFAGLAGLESAFSMFDKLKQKP